VNILQLNTPPDSTCASASGNAPETERDNMNIKEGNN
jgi:hypothetical protein